MDEAALRVEPHKNGTDESSRRAAEWVRDNIGTTIGPPSITEGGTVVQLRS